jgi:hypothetical protein
MTQKQMRPGAPVSPNEPSASPSAPSSNEPLSGLKNELVADAKNVAGDVATGAKKAADAKFGEGKDFAVQRLGSVADALRHTSDHLRSRESDVTPYVEGAANSIDKVSAYLETRNLSQLIADVEGYARREPAVFLGGAFFVGLLGGRFLKSATPSTGAGNGKTPMRAEARRWEPRGPDQSAHQALPPGAVPNKDDAWHAQNGPGPANHGSAHNAGARG